jgi:uncharacterized protein (TIRG00374 family)
MLKRVISNVLRVAISLGLIGYLLYIADIPQILQIFNNANPLGILLAIVIFVIALFIMALRWKILTKSQNINSSSWQLFKYYLIGLFFNNFLPTSIGGDLARAFYLAKDSGSRSASIGTVFLERLIGLLATLSLAFFSLFWLMRYFHTNRIIYIIIMVIFVIALFLASIMSRRIYRRFNYLLTLITFYDIGERLIKVLDTLHFYRDKKMILFIAYIYSLLSQFTIIVMNYVLVLTLGLQNVSFGYLILVVPVTFVIGLLPSINGIGVRDTGYLLLLSRQGLATSQVLSLSLTVTIIPIFISLFGGLFFILNRQKTAFTPNLKEEKVQ